MNAEVKNLLKSNGLTNILIDMIENNVMALTVFGISINNKTGEVSFTELVDFVHLNEVKLSKDEVAAWDLFNIFEETRYAVQTLKYLIEKNAPITEEVFNERKTIAPKKSVEAYSYTDFMGALTDAEKKTFKGIAQEWLAKRYLERTSFDVQAIQGVDFTATQGKFVTFYSPIDDCVMGAKVLDAPENGFITCVDDKGVFTIPKRVEAFTIIEDETELPKDVRQAINSKFNSYIENGKEERMKKFDRFVKDTARREKNEAEQAYKSLLDRKLDTTDAIEEAVDIANSLELTKGRDQKVRKRIREATKRIEDAKAEAEKAKNAKKGNSSKANKKQTAKA